MKSKLDLSQTPTTSTETAASDVEAPALAMVKINNVNRIGRNSASNEITQNILWTWNKSSIDVESGLKKTENIDTPTTSTESAASNTTADDQSSQSQKGRSKIADKFEKFLKDREAEKEKVYSRVSVLGIGLALSTSIFYVLLWNVGSTSSQYTPLFDFLCIILAFTRVLGFVIVSVVPVDEVDFIGALSKNKIIRMVLHTFSILGYTIWIVTRIETPNIAFIVLDCFPALINDLYQVWYLIRDCIGYQMNDGVKTDVFGNEVNDGVMSDEMYGCWLRFLLWILWTGFIFIFPTMETTGYTSYGYDIFNCVIWLPFLIANLAYLGYRYMEFRKGRLATGEIVGVKFLFSMVYQMCVIIAIMGICNAVYYLVAQYNKYNAALWILLVIFDLIPMILVFVLGDDYCFSLCARIFEFDVERQQIDGAFMAALISMCNDRPTISNKNKEDRWIPGNEEVLWINRKEDKNCESLLYEKLAELKYDDSIDRKFWIKAYIIEKATESKVRLRVEYADDVNLALRYHYSGSKLVQETQDLAGSSWNEFKLTDWVKYFEKYEGYQKEGQTVSFWYSIGDNTPQIRGDAVRGKAVRISPKFNEKSDEVDEKSDEVHTKDDVDAKAEEMLSWGKSHLRGFVDSKNFFDFDGDRTFKTKLFFTSPRELSDWTNEDAKELALAALETKEKEDVCIKFMEDTFKEYFMELESRTEGAKSAKPFVESFRSLKAKWKELNILNEKYLRDAAGIKKRDRDVEKKCIDFLEKTYYKCKKGKSPKSLMRWMFEHKLFHEEKLLIAATGSDVEKAVEKKSLDVEKKCLDFLKKECKIDDDSQSDGKFDELKDLKIKWKKKIVYSFSEQVTIKSRLDKIDYFISHSWADDAKNKCLAIEAFIDDFRKSSFRSRWPSFWLDKVCIDQSNPTRGVEVLPINIGACKKILVLMGKTYMKRLWCVWELFMLFTFCNKELGLERMQIICIDDIDVVKEIEDFDIDKAHAFDPNEEYRLRYIMMDVVRGNKVKESFKHMVNLIHLGKVSTIDLRPRTKKRFN